jgi:hypothetical protein
MQNFFAVHRNPDNTSPALLNREKPEIIVAAVKHLGLKIA